MSSMANVELVAAIEMARDAEWEAHTFYLKAARDAQDQRAQDLFEQLAAFEQRHFEKLKELLVNYQIGSFSEYAGMEFRDFKPGVPPATIPAERLQTAIDALQVAIEAEQHAHQTYLTLAEKTVNENAKKMFRRMAMEEEKHRRILEDQFYALSNKGVWAWGE